MKWSRIGSITVAVVLIALFCANIPQSAAANGESLFAARVAGLTNQADTLNDWIQQAGIPSHQLAARIDSTAASWDAWHVVLESTTAVREYMKTTDWNQVVWRDAAGKPYYDRRGGLRVVANHTALVGSVTADDWIEWTREADYQLSGGYALEPLWHFHDRLEAMGAERLRQANAASTPKVGLDGQGRALLDSVRLLKSSTADRQRLLKQLTRFFDRHPTPTPYSANFDVQGYLRILGDDGYGTIRRGWVDADRQVIDWPVPHEPWGDFLTRVCEESGCSVANPDEMVACVTGNDVDRAGIYDILRGAALGQQVYAYIDRYTPATYQALFGTTSGMNDPWLATFGTPTPETVRDHTSLLDDYHLLWVGSDSSTQRSTYTLTRYEADMLAEWVRDGGTLILGSQDAATRESWFPSQSYGQVYAIGDWFEKSTSQWVTTVSGSKWTRSHPAQSYVGAGLRFDYTGAGSSNEFGIKTTFVATPVRVPFYTQFKFWYRSTVQFAATATVVWLDHDSTPCPHTDHYADLSFTLTASSEWRAFTMDLVNACETVFPAYGAPDQLVRVQFQYSGTPTGGDFVEIDEVSASTGADDAREAFLDQYGRGPSYGFGEDFEVLRWTDLTGEDGYRRWDATIANGTGAFHVYAAAPPGAPQMAPGPYPNTDASCWWESSRGPTWIEYVNTTYPTQKRRTTGLDLTNVGTIQQPQWVTDDEYPPTLLIELKNHTVLPFTGSAAFLAVLHAVSSEVFAVGVQTTRATAGFPLDPTTPYALGQLLYGPRLPDRTLPSLGTAMFHIMPRVHALTGGTWSTASLAQVNRQHWQTPGNDPRGTVTVNVADDWTQISYTTNHAAMLAGVWSYTLALRVYRNSPNPRLKLQLTCHSYDLQNLAISYDMTATGWRTGYDIAKLAVRAAATAPEDIYPLTQAQDIATRYATLDPELRVLCQNEEGFLFNLADMMASGFTRPHLQVLDVQLPWGGTRRVLQAGMTGLGSVSQDSRVAIDPTLIAYGTTHNDDVYASKDSASTYEGAADTSSLRLGVDDHQGVPSDWFNGAWAYRKSHVLSSTVAQTNYQVKVVVKRQTGSDSGGTVYVGTNCRADFADLRFTKADGLTLIDHWLESKDSTTATFWIEVPSLVVGSTTIYVYYGNPSAISASNGDATFLFCDDFATWNAGKWSVTEYTGGPHYREVGQGSGELHVNASSSADPSGYYFRTTGQWSEANVAIYAKTRWANLDDHRGAGEFLGVRLIDGGGQATGETVSLYGDYRTYLYRWQDGTAYGYDPDGMGAGPATGNAYFSFTKVGTSWTITLSGTFSHSWPGTITGVSTPYRLQLDAYLDYWTGTVRMDSYFDYIYMRKYAGTEPTHGSWGSEQTLPLLKRANRVLTRFSLAGLPHSPVQRIDSAFLIYPIDSSGGTHSHTVWAIRTTNASWDSSTNAARWGWATTGTAVAATLGTKLYFNVTSHVQALYDANATLATWKLWLDNDAAFSYLDWYLVRSNLNDGGGGAACLNITYSEKPFAPTVANTAILGMEDDGGWGGPNWLDLGWQYRKSHTLTGSTGGALTDYQVRVRVYYGSGTDTGDSVYTGSRCQGDFDDIRLTAADGITLLSHWRESYTVGSSAVFWVKIPSIPASPGTTTFYVYYGNGAASSGSDIGATMLFGDDFTGTSLDLGKWAVMEYSGGAHSYQVTNGELKVHVQSWDTVTSGYAFASVPSWSATNLVMVVKGRWANLDYIRGGGDFLGARIRDAAADETGYSLGLRGSYNVNLWRYPDYPTNALVEWDPADYAAGDTTITLTKLGSAWTLALAGTYTDSWSGTLTVSSPYTLRLSSSLQYWTDTVAVDTYFDYAYLRNYAASEPTHGSWGAQEGGGTGAVDNCYATHTYSVQSRATDLNGWRNIEWVNVSIGADVRLTYHYYFHGQSWVQELSPSGTVVNTSATTLQITWTFTPGWGTSVNDASVTSQAKDYASLVGQEVLSAYVDLIRELRLDGYAATDAHVNPSQGVNFSGQMHYQAAGGISNRWYAGSVQVGYLSGGQFVPIGTALSPNGVFTVPATAPTPVNRYAIYPRVDGAVAFVSQAIDVTVDKLVLEASQVTDADSWVNSGTLFQWTFRCKYAYSGAYISAFTVLWNGQPQTAVGSQVLVQATGYDQAQSFTATPVNDNVDGITTGDSLGYQIVWTRVMATLEAYDLFLNVTGPVNLTVRAWWTHNGAAYDGTLSLFRNGSLAATLVFAGGVSEWSESWDWPTVYGYACSTPVNGKGITTFVVEGAPVCRWDYDEDNDWLVNYEEVQLYGTDPSRCDTDSDGLPDWWETQYGFNPGFYDNFTGRAWQSHWTPVAGNWQVTSHTLWGTGTSGLRWCLLSDRSWATRTALWMHVVLPTGPGKCGVIYAYQNASNYYYVEVEVRNGAHGLLSLYKCYQGSLTLLRFSNCDCKKLRPGGVYWLCISLLDGVHSATLSNSSGTRIVLDYDTHHWGTEPGPIFTDGKVALVVREAVTAGFGNITVAGGSDYSLDPDGDGVVNWVEAQLTSSPTNATDPGDLWGYFVSDAFTTIGSTTFNTVELRAHGNTNGQFRLLLGAWTSEWTNISAGDRLYRFILPTGLSISSVRLELRTLNGLDVSLVVSWLQIFEWGQLPRPLQWNPQPVQNEEFLFISKYGALAGSKPWQVPNGLNSPYGVDVQATIPSWWAQMMTMANPLPGAAAWSLYDDFVSTPETSVSRLLRLEGGDERAVFPFHRVKLEYPRPGDNVTCTSYPSIMMELGSRDYAELMAPDLDALSCNMSDFYPYESVASDEQFGLIEPLYMLRSEVSFTAQLPPPYNCFAAPDVWQWNASAPIAVEAGDVLEYLVFLPDNGWGNHLAGLDVVFTNSSGTSFLFYGNPHRFDIDDQNGNWGDPNFNLAAVALNKWYHREIVIPDQFAGQSLSYQAIELVDETDSPSWITNRAYLGLVRVRGADGTVKVNAFSGDSNFTWGWWGYGRQAQKVGSFPKFEVTRRTHYWLWYDLDAYNQTQLCLRWTYIPTPYLPLVDPLERRGNLLFFHYDVSVTPVGFETYDTYSATCLDDQVWAVSFDTETGLDGQQQPEVKGLNITLTERAAGVRVNQWSAASGAASFEGWSDACHSCVASYVYVDHQVTIDRLEFDIVLPDFLQDPYHENYGFDWQVQVAFNDEALERLGTDPPDDYYAFTRPDGKPLVLEPGFSKLVIYVGLVDITDRHYLFQRVFVEYPPPPQPIEYGWTVQNIEFIGTGGPVTLQSCREDPFQLVPDYLMLQVPSPVSFSRDSLAKAGQVLLYGFLDRGSYAASGSPADSGKWEGLYGLATNGAGFASPPGPGGYWASAGTLLAENILRTEMPRYDQYLVAQRSTAGAYNLTGTYGLPAFPSATAEQVMNQVDLAVTGTLIARQPQTLHADTQPATWYDDSVYLSLGPGAWQELVFTTSLNPPALTDLVDITLRGLVTEGGMAQVYAKNWLTGQWVCLTPNFGATTETAYTWTIGVGFAYDDAVDYVDPTSGQVRIDIGAVVGCFSIDQATVHVEYGRHEFMDAFNTMVLMWNWKWLLPWICHEYGLDFSYWNGFDWSDDRGWGLFLATNLQNPAAPPVYNNRYTSVYYQFTWEVGYGMDYIEWYRIYDDLHVERVNDLSHHMHITDYAPGHGILELPYPNPFYANQGPGPISIVDMLNETNLARRDWINQTSPAAQQDLMLQSLQMFMDQASPVMALLGGLREALVDPLIDQVYYNAYAQLVDIFFGASEEDEFNQDSYYVEDDMGTIDVPLDEWGRGVLNGLDLSEAMWRTLYTGRQYGYFWALRSLLQWRATQTGRTQVLDYYMDDEAWMDLFLTDTSQAGNRPRHRAGWWDGSFDFAGGWWEKYLEDAGIIDRRKTSDAPSEPAVKFGDILWNFKVLIRPPQYCLPGEPTQVVLPIPLFLFPVEVNDPQDAWHQRFQLFIDAKTQANPKYTQAELNIEVLSHDDLPNELEQGEFEIRLGNPIYPDPATDPSLTAEQRALRQQLFDAMKMSALRVREITQPGGERTYQVTAIRFGRGLYDEQGRLIHPDADGKVDYASYDAFWLRTKLGEGWMQETRNFRLNPEDADGVPMLYAVGNVKLGPDGKLPGARYVAVQLNPETAEQAMAIHRWAMAAPASRLQKLRQIYEEGLPAGVTTTQPLGGVKSLWDVMLGESKGLHRMAAGIATALASTVDPNIKSFELSVGGGGVPQAALFPTTTEYLQGPASPLVRTVEKIQASYLFTMQMGYQNRYRSCYGHPEAIFSYAGKTSSFWGSAAKGADPVARLVEDTLGFYKCAIDPATVIPELSQTPYRTFGQALRKMGPELFMYLRDHGYTLLGDNIPGAMRVDMDAGDKACEALLPPEIDWHSANDPEMLYNKVQELNPTVRQFKDVEETARFLELLCKGCKELLTSQKRIIKRTFYANWQDEDTDPRVWQRRANELMGLYNQLRGIAAMLRQMPLAEVPGTGKTLLELVREQLCLDQIRDQLKQANDGQDTGICMSSLIRYFFPTDCQKLRQLGYEHWMFAERSMQGEKSLKQAPKVVRELLGETWKGKMNQGNYREAACLGLLVGGVEDRSQTYPENKGRSLSVAWTGRLSSVTTNLLVRAVALISGGRGDLVMGLQHPQNPTPDEPNLRDQIVGPDSPFHDSPFRIIDDDGQLACLVLRQRNANGELQMVNAFSTRAFFSMTIGGGNNQPTPRNWVYFYKIFPSTTREEVPGWLGTYPRAPLCTVQYALGDKLAKHRSLLGSRTNLGQSADSLKERINTIASSCGDRINIPQGALKMIDFASERSELLGYVNDAVPSSDELLEMIQTNPGDPRAAFFIELSMKHNGFLSNPYTPSGLMWIGAYDWVTDRSLLRDGEVPYRGDPYDPNAPVNPNWAVIDAQHRPGDQYYQQQLSEGEILPVSPGVWESFSGGFLHQMLSPNPFSNAFMYQLVWGPLGLMLGEVFTFLCLCVDFIPASRIWPGLLDMHISQIPGSQGGGLFWWAFDDIDGKQDPYWWLGPALFHSGDGNFATLSYPEHLLNAPTYDQQMYEVWYDEIYKWSLVMGLSFLVWYTDYIDISGDGLAFVSGWDFGMEFFNCFLGGVQSAVATVFQTSCYVTDHWNDTLQLDGNLLDTDREAPYFWLDLNATFIGNGPLTDVDGTIPVVPSYLVPFESVPSVIRHVLCFSVPRWDATLGRWVQFPEWEPTLGLWLMGMGVWWLREDLPWPQCLPAHIWEFLWWAGMMAAAAALTWFTGGGTTFASRVASFAASQVACVAAAAIVNYELSVLSMVLVDQILQGLPVFDRWHPRASPSECVGYRAHGGRGIYMLPC